MRLAYKPALSLSWMATVIMSDASELQKGDKVSWNWGGGKPEGTVVGVYEEDKSIKSKNGNTVCTSSLRYFDSDCR